MSVSQLAEETIERVPAFHCPHCGSPLAAERLEDLMVVRCAACGAHFGASALPAERIVSRKATVSLALALASLLLSLLTAVPAVVVAILALRDIHLRPEKLTGRGIAWSAMIIAVLSGLVTGSILFCTGMTALFIATMEQTEDPEGVKRIASQIGEFDEPDGLQPAFGMSMLTGMREVIYTDKPQRNKPDAILVLVRMPEGMYGSRQQALDAAPSYAPFIDLNVASKDTFVCESPEGEITVTEETGVDSRSGKRARRYVAELPSKDGIVIMVATARDTGESTAEDGTFVTPLDRQQIRKFIESYRPAK